MARVLKYISVYFYVKTSVYWNLQKAEQDSPFSKILKFADPLTPLLQHLTLFFPDVLLRSLESFNSPVNVLLRNYGEIGFLEVAWDQLLIH